MSKWCLHLCAYISVQRADCGDQYTLAHCIALNFRICFLEHVRIFLVTREYMLCALATLPHPPTTQKITRTNCFWNPWKSCNLGGRAYYFVVGFVVGSVVGYNCSYVGWWRWWWYYLMLLIFLLLYLLYFVFVCDDVWVDDLDAILSVAMMINIWWWWWWHNCVPLRFLRSLSLSSFFFLYLLLLTTLSFLLFFPFYCCLEIIIVVVFIRQQRWRLSCMAVMVFCWEMGAWWCVWPYNTGDVVTLL